jgi:hypothetical protein
MEKNQGTARRAQCEACKKLRRSCPLNCIFAPNFSAEEFAAVNRVYGSGNVANMIRCVTPSEQRRVAAATLVAEARARERDPVFGCVSYIRILQEFNYNARKQVDEAREEIAREFGAAAAAEPVDLAAAGPAVRLEARAQVDAALKDARELDARMLDVRKGNDVILWRELQQQQAAVKGKGKGKRAMKGKEVDVKRRRHEPSLSEQTMQVVPQAAKPRNPGPPGFPDDHSRQQVAVAVAEAERTAPPDAPEGHGHGRQLHHQMSEPEAQQQASAADASAGQHTGTGHPHHAGDAAAPDIPAGPGHDSSTSVIRAMQEVQHAGATGEQDQHHVAQHAQNEHCVALGHGDPYGISQDILQLQLLLMGQCGAAPATEQDVTAMMQQMAAAASGWQQQDHPAPQPQYAEMRDNTLGHGHGHPDGLSSEEILQPQELSMEQCDAAVEGTAPAEQDVMAMMQQMAAAASGWQQQDHLAPQPQYVEMRDNTLGHGHGHPDGLSSEKILQLQELLMGQCDAAEEGAAPTEQEVMVMMQQMAAAAWPQQDPAPQYAETDITIGHGHPDMQKLLDTTELARNQLMTNNYVTTMVQQNSSSVLAPSSPRGRTSPRPGLLPPRDWPW